MGMRGEVPPVLAERFDAFLVDLDGVVYVGDRVLPGAVEALHRLRSAGKAVRFLTNDPRPTRAEVAERLRRLGVRADSGEVVSAGWAAARWLAQQGVRRAYALGSAGLKAELQEVGIELTDHAPEAVVVGADPAIAFAEVARACLLIRGGARFVAASADACFPTPLGLLPGAGAVVRAVEVATGVTPVLVGKPEPYAFRLALEGLPPGTRAVMVGDNPDTDVLGAHRAGIAAVLVGSPPSTADGDPRRPDAAIRTLADLFDPAIPFRPWQAPPFPWPEVVQPAVAVVVRGRAGAILLVRRAEDGRWALPAGPLMPGESLEQAARRLVRTAAGIELGRLRLAGLYSCPDEQAVAEPPGRCTQYVTACFAGRTLGGRPRPGGPAALEARYFPVGALPPDLSPPHRRWIADAAAPRPRVR